MRVAAPAVLAAIAGGAALADAPPRSPADIDGFHVTIGPVGAATRVAGEWYSAFGLELSIVNVAERRFPVGLGAAFGGISYAGRDGARLWLEAEAGLGRPVPLGVGAGLAAEVDPVRPPRLGAQTTIWIYWGLVPYVRVGMVRVTGTYVEAGLMLKIPARRFP